MKIKNAKLLKRVLEVSLCTGMILTTVACSNSNISTTIEETVEDDDVFVTYDDMRINCWYLVEIDDINYDDKIYMTKSITPDPIENGTKMYYYKEIFSNSLLGTTKYNIYKKEILWQTGPELISAVSVCDYVQQYNYVKDNYTKADILAIYSHARDNYEKDEFNNLKKQRILIKDY